MNWNKQKKMKKYNKIFTITKIMIKNKRKN